MKRKKFLFVFVVVFVIIASTGWFLAQEQSPTSKVLQAPHVSQEVLRLSFENLDGETMFLADFAGKPVVLNAWATWCSFCRKELVDFVAVQKEFGDKVVIVALDRGESSSTVKQYLRDVSIASDDLVFLLDQSDSFYRVIGGFSMPETLFINADGVIVSHKRGPMDRKEIREKVQEILVLAT